MIILGILFLLISANNGIQLHNASAPQLSFSLPLSTATVNNKVVVVDATGDRVKLACVNWYGAHMEGHVVNGLDKESISSIAKTISGLGFNCIRLPFSLEQVFEDPVIEDNRVSANPGLHGKTSMEVLDATVSGLTDEGLIVLLNNHNSKAGWCCSEQDGEGLWYTHDYPEEMWIQALTSMAERYSGNFLVAGIDLRNELRKAHGHSPTWGGGDPKVDWSMAAEKAGNLVLNVNPNLLILVEGIEYAGNLEGARSHPIKLSHPSQLVYSGHMYPFWYDPTLSYNKFQQRMHDRQTFVTEPGQSYSAAYWMGEFGTGSNDDEWGKIIQYLEESDSDWSYWAIDGYSRPGDDETYGILKDDYVTVRHPWLVDQLQKIMPVLQ